MLETYKYIFHQMLVVCKVFFICKHKIKKIKQWWLDKRVFGPCWRGRIDAFVTSLKNARVGLEESNGYRARTEPPSSIGVLLSTKYIHLVSPTHCCHPLAVSLSMHLSNLSFLVWISVNQIPGFPASKENVNNITVTHQRCVECDESRFLHSTEVLVE